MLGDGAATGLARDYRTDHAGRSLVTDMGWTDLKDAGADPRFLRRFDVHHPRNWDPVNVNCLGNIKEMELSFQRTSLLLI